MKAVITDGKGGVELRDVALPERDAYDCLVKTEAFTFCNSTDSHLVNGTFPYEKSCAGILGHESVGMVLEVGRKVRNLKVGQRVLRPTAVWPNQDLSGFRSLWGGFSEYGKVKDYQAATEDARPGQNEVSGYSRYQQTVPAGIGVEPALLMIALKEIWSTVAALKDNDIRGKRFLLSGAGIAALLLGNFLRRRGAGGVTMTARRQEPLDFALGWKSADEVCLLTAAERLTADYDVLVETTGDLATALRLLAKIPSGGTVWSYAVYPNMQDGTIFEPFRQKHLFVRADPLEWSAHEAVSAQVLEGKLDTAPLITHRFPLVEIQAAWKTVVEKRTIKTVVVL